MYSLLKFGSVIPAVYRFVTVHQTPRSYYRLTGYFVRILLPYLTKRNGIGIRAVAMNPNNEFPHPSPRALYIFWPPNGNTAAKTDRITVQAAMADAACKVKTSTRYVFGAI